MAIHAKILSGLNDQADHVMNNGAPGTAAICRALIALADGDSLCGRRIAGWNPEAVLRDALPLRIAGGFHDLFRRGFEPELGKIYRGEMRDQGAVEALVADIVSRHDADLLKWFDGPPQTNEAGRSASFIAALHWLASRVAPNFELNEIGSSAGMNLLIDSYAYDLNGVTSGPDDAPVIIKPVWNGPPPPADLFAITSVQGCDIEPIDVRDDAAAGRLMAYIWPEMPERFIRMEAGIKMIRDQGIDLVQADAGSRATAETPLAWISLETNRATFRHELKIRYWPEGGESVTLGEAHAHGIWINWTGN